MVSDAGIIAAEVRRLREENERLANDMSRCYRMLLSEPDVKARYSKPKTFCANHWLIQRNEHRRTDPRPARSD